MVPPAYARTRRWLYSKCSCIARLYTEGIDIEDVKRNAKEAIELFIESLNEHGEEISLCKETVIRGLTV